MASKRTINRAYWVAVKAEAAGADHVISPAHVFKRCLQGIPDRVAVPLIKKYEDRYGPARLADVSNKSLWQARDKIDAIRQEYQRQ